jgi:hypothetical protein
MTQRGRHHPFDRDGVHHREHGNLYLVRQVSVRRLFSTLLPRGCDFSLLGARTATTPAAARISEDRSPDSG